MNASVHRQLIRRKRSILRSIEHKPVVEAQQPMMAAFIIRYEITDRTRAISPGGLASLGAPATQPASSGSDPGMNSIGRQR